MTKNKSDYKSIIELLFKHSPSPIMQPKIHDGELDNIINLLFLNKHTFQLNKKGLAIFSSIFKPFPIQFPEKYQLRSKDLIILDRECNLPYYVNVRTDKFSSETGNYLVLFEKELAIILKLCDCDLDMIQNMPRDAIF